MGQDMRFWVEDLERAELGALRALRASVRELRPMLEDDILERVGAGRAGRSLSQVDADLARLDELDKRRRDG